MNIFTALLVFASLLVAPVYAETKGKLRKSDLASAVTNDFSRRLEAEMRSNDHTRSFADNDPLGGRNLFPNSRWKDRVGDVVIVPYQIGTQFNSQHAAVIESSLQALQDKVKVVKFVKRTTQSAYIRIVSNSGGCSSRIGRDSSGRVQELQLGIGNFPNGATCVQTGVTQHEFLHALVRNIRQRLGDYGHKTLTQTHILFLSARELPTSKTARIATTL